MSVWKRSEAPLYETFWLKNMISSSIDDLLAPSAQSTSNALAETVARMSDIMIANMATLFISGRSLEHDDGVLKVGTPPEMCKRWEKCRRMRLYHIGAKMYSCNMDLNIVLVFVALVMVSAIFGSRISSKSGMPVLLIFLVLGMLAGVDGLLGIDFEDYDAANTICSAALIFIMFYGGFGTSWKAARPVAAPSIVLASAGVVMTAMVTGVFCHLVLGMQWLDAMLLGSVLSSTDAASVFSILRSRRLSLKYGTSSLLEMESGSNDPAAYMLVMIFLEMRSAGSPSFLTISYDVFSQVVYAMAIGVALAWATKQILGRFSFPEGFTQIFILAVALLSYALPSLVGGNGYLGAYLVGILLGNMKMEGKKDLVSFFNVFNGMMQILIFFLLGLLASPRSLLAEIHVGLLISVCMILVARPVTVALLTLPFRFPLRQQAVICMAGLRGASSIVFSIVVTVAGAYAYGSIFNTVFVVVLVSILLQGTLLPFVSRKVGMIDEEEDVLKTFNDYEESSIEFVPIQLSPDSAWTGRRIMDIDTPPDSIVAAIERDGVPLVPKGDSVLNAGDRIILGMAKPQLDTSVSLCEETVSSHHPWVGRTLGDIRPKELVLMILRDGKCIIPTGGTEVRKGDVLVKNEQR